MHVLVVGGTGLIGRHAAVELLARGHRVRILARRPPPAGALPEGVAFAQGDLLEGSLEVALAGVDAVVHAAGTDYRTTPRRPAWDFYRRVNVEASARLFAAASAAGARRGVFVTSYYHALRPELVAVHPYIRSRAESEEAVLRAVGDRLAVCIVQPPFVLGRIDGRDNLAARLAAYARSRWPLLAPRGGTNFIAARSLAEAIAAALERGDPGARYLPGDENLRWTALLERFAALARRPRRSRAVPDAGVVCVAAALKGWASLFGREPGVEPVAWVRVLCSELYCDTAAAQQALGYRTGLLDEAMREATYPAQARDT